MQPDPDPTDPTPGMHLWGWMSPAELRWLGDRAAEVTHPGAVVEVGCLHGRSSYALGTGTLLGAQRRILDALDSASTTDEEATLVPPAPVYCIDPWSDDGWASWRRSLAELPHVVPIRAPSPAAGDRVPDPVDLVFIDGAHDYDSVVADVRYWLPRTRRLLCGHDYVPLSALAPGENPGFPDVPRAVDELLGPGSVAARDLAVELRLAPDTAIWYVELGG